MRDLPVYGRGALLLGPRRYVTRQEILFLGPPPGDTRFRPPAMPAWLHHAEQVYGTPDLESRGFKLAFDLHGPSVDPETSDRTVAPESASQARAYLARRFPDRRGDDWRRIAPIWRSAF